MRQPLAHEVISFLRGVRLSMKSVRSKVLVELGIIAAFTVIFLVLFPRRNPLVDVALAGFALLCIAVASPYSRNVIWTATPSPVTEDRTRECLAVTFWITLPVALVFLSIGGVMAYKNGGWSAVGSRIFNWRILAAFGC